jgi:hypothetical protein
MEYLVQRLAIHNVQVQRRRHVRTGSYTLRRYVHLLQRSFAARAVEVYGLLRIGGVPLPRPGTLAPA